MIAALDECTLISSQEYMDLHEPEFVGQTRVVAGTYYMVWKAEGKLYKTKNTL